MKKVCKDDIITIQCAGSSPQVYCLSDQKIHQYKSLHPDTLLGRALIGHSCGETIIVKTQSKALEYEIIDIKECTISDSEFKILYTFSYKKRKTIVKRVYIFIYSNIQFTTQNNQKVDFFI